MFKWLKSIWNWLAAWDLLLGKSVSLRRAEAIAKFLLQVPGVKGVQLFGGTARRGWGHDIDLICIVDQKTMRRFVGAMKRKRSGYAGRARTRLWVAGLILKIDLKGGIKDLQNGLTQEGIIGSGYPFTPLDIFLFTEDWETNRWLKKELPCEDPNFLKNIACDAVRYHRVSNQFAHMSGKTFSKYRRFFPMVWQIICQKFTVLTVAIKWRLYDFQCWLVAKLRQYRIYRFLNRYYRGYQSFRYNTPDQNQ